MVKSPTPNIGLFVNTIEVHSDGSPNDWSTILAKVQTAEQLGFDSVWLMDRLFFAAEDQTYGVWSPTALLPALAMATDRIQLGTWVLSAAYRHPALLAKTLATIHAISGGRLLVGIGPGNEDNDPETERYDLPNDGRYRRFVEAFTVLRQMLREGTSNHEGRQWRMQDAVIAPPTPTDNGPPLFVAARGGKMLRQAAERADGWAGMAYTGPAALDTFRDEMARVDAACQAVSRDPATLARAYMVFVGVPDEGESDSGASPWITCRGSVEEIASCLRGFMEAGVSYLLLSPVPDTPAAVERLGPVVRAIHAQIPSR